MLELTWGVALSGLSYPGMCLKGVQVRNVQIISHQAFGVGMKERAADAKFSDECEEGGGWGVHHLPYPLARAGGEYLEGVWGASI